MDSIKKLKEIGLGEVSRRTHIEVKQLEYMVANRYEKLHKTNTIGFVKILSREYKIDLTEWVENFKRYCEEQEAEEDLQKERFFVRAKNERDYGKIISFFSIIILLAAIVWAFSFFKIDLNMSTFLGSPKAETNKTSAFQQTSDVVKETATTLGVKVEERIVESNSSNATVQAVVVSIDDNKTEENITSDIKKPVDENVTLVKTEPDHAIISPTKRVWIGVVMLDTMSRKEYLNEQNITINLKKRQIIKTGNGFFKLTYDGSVEDFTEQGATRFLVENGKIEKISQEKFVELNKGKNW